MTTTGANVRSSASMSGSVVRVLDAGTRVRVVGQEGSWRRVADPSGEPWGWVHGSILR
ncbi:SH3 domain-containing protein [Dankookia sp. P2]|uniref:SH3 domain-containing protein n=1 Tax=Dankookia sp. P2 TaxID=3423955 RepID=UPI003D6670B1